MGHAAVKKQRKPVSQPKKRKGRTPPLPLDTSRGRRPAAAKPSTPIARPASRPPSAARSRTSLSPRGLPGLWQRLTTMSRSGRADAAMLALPVLLVAFTIAVGRWTNAERSAPQTATVTVGAKRALTGLPPTATPVAVRLPEIAPQVAAPSSLVAAADPIDPPEAPAGEPDRDLQTAINIPPVTLPAATAETEPAATRPVEPQPIAAPGPPQAHVAAAGIAPAQPLAAAAPRPEPLPPTQTAPQQVAGLLPDRAVPSWDLPGGPEALATGLSQCRFEPASPRTPIPAAFTPGDPESFGLALAAAARSQLQEFVIYNDRYTRMKYPMGDVHPMYGVCTDVVIRAYRALGLDLQELVQTTKTGSGDPNIDHRRVDTLRKFFSRFGQSLPISSFAEDYKPGDIVTYWRPQNRHSRTHIAIVSDMTGPSGRPLIIHNRGWGPQQEDGLFVDEITGHYRFSGLKPSTPETLVRTEKNATKAPAARTKPLKPVVRTGLAKPPAPPL